MRLHRVILILTLLCTACSVIADDIRWLSTTYDFGSFRESDGKKTGQVKFINTGTTPTVINRVKSTCGCTVAKFYDSEIAPGDTATISFTYDPEGRPGRFEKHIKAYTGEDNRLTTITIKGTVIGSDSSLSLRYPVIAGPIRLSADSINLGQISTGTSRNEFIYGYNQSADTLLLSWRCTDKAISIAASSEKIAPGDLFTLGIYVSTRKDTPPGPRIYSVTLSSQPHESTIINIYADIRPKPQALTTEQLRRSPSIDITPSNIHFAQARPTGTERAINLTIKNSGKSELIIRKVISPDEAVQVKSYPKKIKPGKTKNLTARLIIGALPDGNLRIPLEIISNDPLHPTTTIIITGN